MRMLQHDVTDVKVTSLPHRHQGAKTQRRIMRAHHRLSALTGCLQLWKTWKTWKTQGIC